jgi:hypothetical protein
VELADKLLTAYSLHVDPTITAKYVPSLERLAGLAGG